MKRRLLLKSLGASAVAAPWLLHNANAAQTGAGQQGSETAELLFVQTAHAVELKDGMLRLSAVNPVTIFFRSPGTHRRSRADRGFRGPVGSRRE